MASVHDEDFMKAEKMTNRTIRSPAKLRINDSDEDDYKRVSEDKVVTNDDE